MKPDPLTDLMMDNYENVPLRKDHCACPLPSEGNIRRILALAKRLVFPGYFWPDSGDGSGNRLRTSFRLRKLFRLAWKEIASALLYLADGKDRRAVRPQSRALAAEFLASLPVIRQTLVLDLEAHFAGDPAAFNRDEIVVSYPGLRAILVHRLAHRLWELGVPLLPRMMAESAHRETGIDIHPGAQIGPSFFIDHGTGVVIGETTVIGEHVKLYQGVTLGALSTRGGQSLRGSKRHPTLGDRVTVYAGATILGGETFIGDDSVIAANAFLTASVRNGSKVRAQDPDSPMSGSVPKGE